MKNLENKIKYIPAVVGIPILSYLIISVLLKMNKIEQNIENNKYETIGKVYNFVSNRSSSSYYFNYYYEGKKYNKSNLIDYFDGEECVNKYYKINLSTKNPNYSKIFLDQEVTDSAEIVNAGFEYK